MGGGLWRAHRVKPMVAPAASAIAMPTAEPSAKPMRPSPSGAQRALLPGGRWHFQHGPIDIVIAAEGDTSAVQAAHAAAWQRFQTVLHELVAELPRLRQPVRGSTSGPIAGTIAEPCPLNGPIARQMWAACQPLVAEADGFITPMAAVAGSVAMALITAYWRPGVQRAWVNNGGDIALHLAPGFEARVGLYADLSRFDMAAAACTTAGTLRTDAAFVVRAHQPVRGVATSGWRGRSLSRGIADSVTVLAANAAMADAGATVIANAVNVADANIVRRPANSVRDDSDLGDIAVTVAVPTLAPAQVQRALRQGLACAQGLQDCGLVFAAVLVCQGSFERLLPRQPLEWRPDSAPSLDTVVSPPACPTFSPHWVQQLLHETDETPP